MLLNRLSFQHNFTYQGLPGKQRWQWVEIAVILVAKKPLSELKTKSRWEWLCWKHFNCSFGKVCYFMNLNRSTFDRFSGPLFPFIYAIKDCQICVLFLYLSQKKLFYYCDHCVLVAAIWSWKLSGQNVDVIKHEHSFYGLIRALFSSPRPHNMKICRIEAEPCSIPGELYYWKISIKSVQNVWDVLSRLYSSRIRTVFCRVVHTIHSHCSMYLAFMIAVRGFIAADIEKRNFRRPAAAAIARGSRKVRKRKAAWERLGSLYLRSFGDSSLN